MPDFHPVTSSYVCGFVNDDGETCFITARPFKISSVIQEIDFVSTMVQRQPSNKFGDFEFHKIETEKGRESAWLEKRKGVFELTPKDDFYAIETVIVHYYDKTTKMTTRAICQFVQSSVQIAETIEYQGIIDSNNSAVDAYRSSLNPQNYQNYSRGSTTGILMPEKNPDYEFLYVVRGFFKPATSGNYLFSITGYHPVALYISEKQLSYDPDLDAEYLIIDGITEGLSYDTSPARTETSMYLDSSKRYNIVFLYYRDSVEQVGKSWLGQKLEDGSYSNFPPAWLQYKETSEEKAYINQYKPRFEKIYSMDKWNGPDFIPESSDKWVFLKYPPGNGVTSSTSGQGVENFTITVKECVTDGDSSTEWRTFWWKDDTGPIPAYPHIFEIDLGETKTIDELYIGGTGNKNWYDMNSYTKIFIAPYNYSVVQSGNETIPPYKSDNYSLEHNESLVYSGIYNTATPYIQLDKSTNGRYLRIEFHNNSKLWKDNNKGQTSISSIEIGHRIIGKKIVPITNTKIIEKSGTWKETRSGFYYNGKGYTGTKGNKLTISPFKGCSEITVLGDYWPGIGRAKVKLDGREVGEIHDNLLVNYNNKMLKYASRSYRAILFYVQMSSDKQHTVTIEVTEGEVTIAGFITNEAVLTYETDPQRTDVQQVLSLLEQPSSVDNIGTSLSGGAIAGITVVCIVVAAGVAFGLFVFIKKPPFIMDKIYTIQDKIYSLKNKKAPIDQPNAQIFY